MQSRDWVGESSGERQGRADRRTDGQTEAGAVSGGVDGGDDGCVVVVNWVEGVVVVVEEKAERAEDRIVGGRAAVRLARQV